MAAEALAVIENEVKDCKKCPELCASRTKTVFGTGNADARIVIVGEAPGKNEDEQGIPFCGAAGQLLDNILFALGLSRQKVFICNVLKCRPPANRVPTEQERLNCYPFLGRQLEAIDPKIVILLGSIATQTVLGQNIEACRGQIHEDEGVLYLPTYHPAAILWEKSQEKQKQKKLAVWSDLAPLREWLKTNSI